MTLYCATSNPGKVREFSRYHQVEMLPGIHQISPPRETGVTYAENAELKSVYYSQFTDQYVFADDSGLSVDALNGEPGVHSARYAGPNATNDENNAKLLANLHGIANRSARFVCHISLAKQGKTIAGFEASVEGRIIDKPNGTNGFGYDPLFWYEPFQATFAEATLEQKQQVSHRAQAFEKMIAWLRSQG